MSYVNAALAARIRTARRSRGWTVNGLAQRCQDASGKQWHTTTVKRLEDGAGRPYLDQAVTLADVLGFPLGELAVKRAPDGVLDGSLSTLRELDEELLTIEPDDAELPEIPEEVR